MHAFCNALRLELLPSLFCSEWFNVAASCIFFLRGSSSKWNPEFKTETDFFQTSIHSYLLFYYLHLILDRHSSDAEGSAQLRSSFLLQQLAVVLDDAVSLPRQLSLESKEKVFKSDMRSCTQIKKKRIYFNGDIYEGDVNALINYFNDDF